MCAWRFSNVAGSKPNLNSNFADAFSSPVGGGVLGGNTAGAFLRQNAATSRGGRDTTAGLAAAAGAGAGLGGAAARGDEYDDDEEFEEEEEDFEELEEGEEEPQQQQRSNNPSGVPSLQLQNASFGRVQTNNTNSLGAVLMNVANNKDAVNSRGGAAKSALAMNMNSRLGAGLSRQLFKTPDTRQSAFAAHDEDEEDEEDIEFLTEEDRNFIINTRELFEEVDPELLSPDFVPHEHVIGIIATDAGDEARPEEIDERLGPYQDLEEDIDLDLGDYIEVHHEEFNSAIGDFSQMILAVSGSDDTLANLKVQLAEATLSLETHAEQLHALRQRAAKSLFMAETLQRISAALSMEADTRVLISGKHYLAGVRVLQQLQAQLEDPGVSKVRATQGLAEFVRTTANTLHSQIIDDLLLCVFRQERLQEADTHLVDELIEAGEAERRDTTTAGGDGAGATGQESTLSAYWQDAAATADEDAAGLDKRDDTRPKTLADVLDSCFDDPSNTELAQDYSRFIPICVKSLHLLRKMDYCHEAFFSKATKSIERFIAHFFRLYDSWRRKSVSKTNLSANDRDQDGAAAVRAIKLKAFELTNELVSSDEAVATVQSRELRTMLNALFTELEKVLRNADYLKKMVLVANYPFLAPFLAQRVPLDVEATFQKWEIESAPIESVSSLIDIVAESVGTVRRWIAEDRKNSAPESEQMQACLRAERSFQYLEEFFDYEGFLAPWDANYGTAASEQGEARAGAEAAGAGTQGSGSDATRIKLARAGGRHSAMVTLKDLFDYITQEVVPKVIEKYGAVEESSLTMLVGHLTGAITKSMRRAFAVNVRVLYQQWDLQVLWSQLNYHIEFVFHVLCDAKEAEDEGDDWVTLAPFLRQKNLVSRVQKTAAIMKEIEKQSDESVTVDRLLGNFQSTGLLRMLEETGTISFSLCGAVKKAQFDLRKSNEGQARQFDAMQSETARLKAMSETAGGGGGGVGGANAPLVLMQAALLRHWFVFTAMNVLACHESANRFYNRCCDRIPELRRQSQDESVLGFFKKFFRTTYTPTLHAFHSQKLQQYCAEMETNIGDRGGEQGKAAAPESSSWPSVHVPTAAFPVLASVHYTGRVLEKVAGIRRQLPDSLAEDVEQSASEALVIELAVFLRDKLQGLVAGTIQYRLLNRAFEDAFAGLPNPLWTELCDEQKLWQTHTAVDKQLFTYYAFNSAQRTSGHEYNRNGTAAAAAADLEKASAANESSDVALDARIGLLSPKELSLRTDSSLVALAVLCYSAEWLCGVLLRFLWPGAERFTDYTSSIVPGYRFAQQLSVGDTANPSQADKRNAQKVRLSAHLSCLCALSQASLFFLSIEARFTAFQYIPQLRDESYDAVAASHIADNFVLAYASRINKIYSVLKQHLHPQKIKYTCATVGKPTSDLVLFEIAHLRDKAISDDGVTRLRMDIIAMQTVLQLILPLDSEVREAVSRYFSRPAIFIGYIRNRDVVNEIIPSGDYKRFTTEEVEELIRLVFRQVAGANDDTLAKKNIAAYRSKIRAMEKLQEKDGDAKAPPPPVVTPRDRANAPRRKRNNNRNDDDDDEEEEEEEEEEEYEEDEEDDRSRHLHSTTSRASSAVKADSSASGFDDDIDEEEKFMQEFASSRTSRSTRHAAPSKAVLPGVTVRPTVTVPGATATPPSATSAPKTTTPPPPPPPQQQQQAKQHPQQPPPPSRSPPAAAAANAATVTPKERTLAPSAAPANRASVAAATGATAAAAAAGGGGGGRAAVAAAQEAAEDSDEYEYEEVTEEEEEEEEEEESEYEYEEEEETDED